MMGAGNARDLLADGGGQTERAVVVPAQRPTGPRPRVCFPERRSAQPSSRMRRSRGLEIRYPAPTRGGSDVAQGARRRAPPANHSSFSSATQSPVCRDRRRWRGVRLVDRIRSRAAGIIRGKFILSRRWCACRNAPSLRALVARTRRTSRAFSFLPRFLHGGAISATYMRLRMPSNEMATVSFTRRARSGEFQRIAGARDVFSPLPATATSTAVGACTGSYGSGPARRHRRAGERHSSARKRRGRDE